MSSSFQQNWIHSIRTSFAKVMAVQVLLLEPVRRWSGVSGHRSLRPKDPESPAPHSFLLFCQSVVRPCCLSGGSPEMVRSLRSHRSLRPKDPESPAPVFLGCFASVWCRSVGSPEYPRRVPGVSGLAGVSDPNDRNLRPSTSSARPESSVTWSGVSGLNGPNG